MEGLGKGKDNGIPANEGGHGGRNRTINPRIREKLREGGGVTFWRGSRTAKKKARGEHTYMPRDNRSKIEEK